jgi:hypothetical protein
MRKRGWKLGDFEKTPNRIILQMLAADRLEAERANRKT